jgi:hypothetical protein
MASKHREQNVIAAVKCPKCGAVVGKLCRVNEKSRISQGRPVLHQERREAWQEWKKTHAQD